MGTNYITKDVSTGDGEAFFINLGSFPALIEAAEIHSAPRGFYQLGVLQVDCAIYSHFLISQFKVPHFL